MDISTCITVRGRAQIGIHIYLY